MKTRIKCTLADLGEVVGGATPSTKKQEFWDGDIPWLCPKDLTNCTSRYVSRGSRNITKLGFESCSTKLLPAGSILFSSRAPIGYIAIAKNSMCTNQGFKSIVPNENVDSLFMYYLLKHNKSNIENLGSGTTFKEVSASTMRNVEVEVPESLEEQTQIAHILSAFDSKIEVNNKLNAKLEELADLLFAKFVDSKDNTWQSVSLLDIANYKNGLAMQKFRPENGDVGLPVLKIKELGAGECDDNSDRCRSDIDENVKIHDGDLVFSWSGTLLLDFWAGGDAGLNQHLFKVTSEEYPNWFYYEWTKHHLAKFISIAKDKATTMGHIKRSALKESEVFLPPKDVLRQQTQVMQPLIDQIIGNKIESRTLATLRDTLLPKLMRGELTPNT